MFANFPNIVKVEVLPGYALRVKFRNGGWREIALEGFLARYKSVAALRDATLFVKSKVIDWGAAIGWPGGVSIGADTLWRLSQEQLTFGPEEFAAGRSAFRFPIRNAPMCWAWRSVPSKVTAAKA